MTSQNRPLSSTRKFFFSLLVIVFFFSAAEILLSVAGIQPTAINEDPYVGFAGQLPLFLSQPQADGSNLLVTAKNKLGFFNKQSFPEIKNQSSYRIFCMGGSTTYGRPYEHATSFCGWLEALLKKAQPERDWQVINAGGISYASYRVAALMEELVHYQPDLFLVYSGHNEFLEERTYREILEMPDWLIEINARLAHTRVYTALKTAVKSMSPDAGNSDVLSTEVNEILGRTRGPESYQRDDQLKKQIIKHYRSNLIRMTDIARAAGSGQQNSVHYPCIEHERRVSF